MSSYVKEIASIDKELKRLNFQVKKLREQKKKAETSLYYYMQNHNLETFENYKLLKLQPKEKVLRKKAKEKKKDAIDLFREIGIDDPETFYDQFKQTQK